MTAVIRRQTRPNDEVPFYSDPTFKQYVLENWVLANKIIVGQDVSDDGLVATTYLEFVAPELYEEWKNDPVVIENKEKSLAYNKANGIKTSTDIS